MDGRPIPPRLLVALALVGAAGLVVLAEIVTMATVSSPDLGVAANLGLLDRLRLGTRLIDLPVVTVVPLAVLLSRLVEPGSPQDHQAATRTVLTGASAVGASLVLLVVVRLLADLGGQEYVVDARPRLAALLIDLGSLLVAGAGALWASRELQRRPGSSSSSGAPMPAVPPSAPSVPSVPGPVGFPSGPPQAAPPTAPGRDWEGEGEHR